MKYGNSGPTNRVPFVIFPFLLSESLEQARNWMSDVCIFFVVFHSNELTRLWNLCPDNLEACKAENR